jgi:hypothetical protein
MKLHHAAALTLVGWYLITAPTADQGAIIYQDAPLSQWTKAQHFDSETGCDTGRQQLINNSQEALALVPDSEVDEDDKRDASNAVNHALASQCVADNDPRVQSTDVNVGPSLLKRMVH